MQTRASAGPPQIIMVASQCEAWCEACLIQSGYAEVGRVGSLLQHTRDLGFRSGIGFAGRSIFNPHCDLHGFVRPRRGTGDSCLQQRSRDPACWVVEAELASTGSEE